MSDGTDLHHSAVSNDIRGLIPLAEIPTPTISYGGSGGSSESSSPVPSSSGKEGSHNGDHSMQHTGGVPLKRQQRLEKNR